MMKVVSSISMEVERRLSQATMAENERLKEPW